MRIVNKTRWSTDNIRYILGECCRMLGFKSTELEARIFPRRLRREPTATIGGNCTWHAHNGRLATFNGKRKATRLRYIIALKLSNAPKDLDPTGDEHTERVLEFARAACDALLYAHGGAPNEVDRPIPWLADWYEINRGEKGKKAGCPVSPLMPQVVVVPTKAEQRAEALAHAREKLQQATTRRKRAQTIEKKWARRVAYYERLVKR